MRLILAALSKQSRDVFYDIVRKNQYSNIDTIHYQCLAEGLIIDRSKLVKYAKKLKREDANRVRQNTLLRQRKIKHLLSKIRKQERLLLRELNKLNIKLNKTQQ